jgi:hypothetical protein
VFKFKSRFSVFSVPTILKWLYNLIWMTSNLCGILGTGYLFLCQFVDFFKGFFFYLLFFVFLGMKSRALSMLGKCSTTELHLSTLFFFGSTGWTQDFTVDRQAFLLFEPLHQPALFCEGFFEIGSHELFAQAGFEPQSSWSSASWVARIIPVRHQYPASFFFFFF